MLIARLQNVYECMRMFAYMRTYILSYFLLIHSLKNMKYTAAIIIEEKNKEIIEYLLSMQIKVSNR
jgi:hypothetical protein